ncbi:MAG: hypothetical protein ACK5JD_04905 [Mangrovibacterium sp.]
MEKQGRHILHMEVGEPDFDMPLCVKEAVVDAVSGNQTHYMHSLSDPELREAISEHYRNEYQADVAPS